MPRYIDWRILILFFEGLILTTGCEEKPHICEAIAKGEIVIVRDILRKGLNPNSRFSEAGRVMHPINQALF